MTRFSRKNVAWVEMNVGFTNKKKIKGAHLVLHVLEEATDCSRQDQYDNSGQIAEICGYLRQRGE